MTKRERMSSVDTAWLRMDRPTNLMVIAGVLIFEERLNFTKLKRVVTDRLLSYRRFRQRPVTDSTGAAWVDDPDFDLARHILRVKLPGTPDEAALKAFVAELIATPLDPAKPLWEFALIENYRGGAALVSRVHHCYADGIALIGVMLSLTDLTPAIAAKTPPSATLNATAIDTKSDANPLAQFFEPVRDAIAAASRMSNSLLERSIKVLRNPTEMTEVARLGAAIATEIAQLAMMPDDSPTRFKGRPGVTKRVAWTAPLPLDEVKAVGRVFGCSVNDVLLACAAGALRSYLIERGDAADGVESRAMIPVNLRSPGKEGQLGNRFGLVALELPVGMANPVARLYEVHRRMEALKQSFQAPLTLGILGIVGLCPKPIQDQVLNLLASKATAVMTNVPGPQHPLYLAGSKLAQLMFWVPQSGDIGMGVSILSYNGGVQFGLVTDAGLTPDPERIVAHFQPEFEQLLWTVLMEPWDMQREPALIDAELAQAQRASEQRVNLRGSRARARRPAAP